MLYWEKLKKQYREWLISEKEYVARMWKLYRKLKIID